MRVVCNSSPLILLAKIHRLDLLAQFYDQVILPASVLNEVSAKPGEETEQLRLLPGRREFQIQEATKLYLEGIPMDLGLGEREAIALALELKADFVILDDQQGRRIAREKGLSVTGTVGILVEAREKGAISSVRSELDRLIEAGMWIDEAFYHRILQEYRE